MSDDVARVALLTSGETLPAWAADAVKRLVAETPARITLEVRDASSSDRSPVETLRRAVELREWAVVGGLAEALSRDIEPLERRPVDDLPGIDDAERIRCEPETVDGWKNALPDPAVDRLAETDAAVRFGFGFLVGDALSAPDRGVLSFHHGNLREYRGQPMGFWEYVHGRETAGVTLQRLNETLDGGEIVAERRVRVGDAPTWRAVRRRLFAASEPMLADGVRDLRDPDFEPENLAEDELGDLYTLPKGRPVLTFVEKTARGALLG
ncbi:formyltransferase family protein [Halomicrobium salinisoli]|uniref:formyltransferase family protein n=1 Tax=Halomicrobium salinisoli TaxID=2878391 RepID=UPI001CF06042|nr:formyltransferase family protein [Halomicrobium salinisoli]